jgi:transcriptional regulator with XRE-family HTH domain
MNASRKIKKYRELRNYTQAYMSDRLNISQNTYSKIETGGIKLTVERLRQIAEILEIPVEDILTSDNQSFTFNNSNIDKFYGYIETIQEDNKELIQSTINVLNEQILYLRKENERLTDIISKMGK